MFFYVNVIRALTCYRSVASALPEKLVGVKRSQNVPCRLRDPRNAFRTGLLFVSVILSHFRSVKQLKQEGKEEEER